MTIPASEVATITPTRIHSTMSSPLSELVDDLCDLSRMVKCHHPR